jgi:hypothetical protein
MQRWEYYFLMIDVRMARQVEIMVCGGSSQIPFGNWTPFAPVVKELGEQGWELVSANKEFLAFKRPT